MNTQDLYRQAVQIYQSGDLATAEQLFRQILGSDPNHAPSLHVMGLIAMDVDKTDVAEELVRSAIDLQPNIPTFYLSLGRILNRQDKKEAAIESYNAALKLKPDFTDALNNLGTVYLGSGEHEKASDIFLKILKENPQDFNALCNMASIYYQQGEFEKSIEHCRTALTLNTNRPSVYYDLGMSLLAIDDIDEALKHLLTGVELKPDYIDALLAVGNIYRHKGAADTAISYYAKIKAIEFNEYAFIGTAMAYLDQRKLEEALVETEYVLSQLPDSPRILNFLGTLYDKGLIFQDALKCYNRAIEVDPGFYEAYANKSNTLKNFGQLQESIECVKKAIELSPDTAWLYTNLLLTMLYASFVSPEQLAQASREFGQKITDHLMRERPFTNDRNPDRKLRIGYVSPDFRKHAVSYFLSPIYKRDKENFELFAYSKAETEDAVTENIKKYFDHWRDIKFTIDKEAADMIERDKIDILIDPAGHTGRNGLMIFARKPAPIQVTWLGYTATTGMKAMDYRITDSYAEPVGLTEHLNTETLWRLPDIFAAYAPHENSPDVIDHPPFEDNGHIIFGCFNNFTKVTDPVLDVWAKIMAQVPDAKLMFEIAGIDDEKTRADIEERITAHGIPKDRLILMPYKRANQYVLYNKIDIALDPFPAVGGTTSMDTLWMGVPFVTLAGQDFRSRMGVSILSNAGLQKLIAQNAEEYVKIAVDLAYDKERLRTIRHNLRARVAASPLMDQERFARNFENALRQMWHAWVKSGQ
jgi:protein O-GlcNAc transferase